MKKLALFLLVTVMSLTACVNDRLEVSNSSDEILYEGAALTSLNVNLTSGQKIPIFNEPISIQRISKDDPLILNEIDNLEKLGVDLGNFDFTQIRVYKYKNLPTTALIIPKINGKNADELVIYLNSQKTSYAYATYSKINAEENEFKLSSLNHEKVYYSMVIRSDNKIKSFKLRKEVVDNQGPLLRESTCPESTDNFSDCMTCAIADECAGDWVCAAACMVAPVPCLIGFGIACSFF